MIAGLKIRFATPDDAPILAHHRTQMWLDMGDLNKDAIAEMNSASEAYFRDAVVAKEYIGWVIENAENVVVAGGGFTIRFNPPFPDKNKQTVSSAYTAHVFNVYVAPNYRKQGLARWLMQTIAEHCQHHNIRTLTLNASAAGRPLYESLGYVEVRNFMRLLVY